MKQRLVAYVVLGCLAALAAVAASIAGLPYGRMEYTAFAELYHDSTNTFGEVHFAIDCDPAIGATQDTCTYSASSPPATIDVDVTMGNSTGGAFVLSAFGFEAINPDQTRLDASTIDNPGVFDDNPDFDQSSITGTWQCDPPPTDDYTPEPPENSLLTCFNGAGNGPAIITGPLHLRFGTITYDTVINPVDGDVSLTLDKASAYDDTFSEVGSCNPVLGVHSDCFGATIVFTDDPTPTPTPCSPPDCRGCPDDYDCDGFLEHYPPAHFGPNNTNHNFDNCPLVAPNSAQLNADGNFIDQSPPWGIDDLTRANSDMWGDVCDGTIVGLLADMDNDGRPSETYPLEAACNGSGVPDGFNPDTDGDRVMDGAECVLGSNPTDALSKPAMPAAGQDPDNDKLSTAFEMSLFTLPNDIDSDNDGLQDGWEYKGYNSNPTFTDTDGDGIKDGCEVASINGDTVVNPGDQALLAAEIIRPVPQSQKLANMDLNKDGVINPGDQAFQASMALPGKCPVVS